MMNKLKNTLIFAFTALLISACSGNSSFVLRSAYNNMDFILKSKLNSYADFNESQQKWIDVSVTDFHEWHRANQLPQIAKTLDSAMIFLNENQGYPQEVIEAYFLKARSLYTETYLSSPLFDSPPLLKTLTEKQVTQITEKIQENREEYFEDQRKDAEKSDIRIERLDRFLEFFEIDLNTEQRQYVESKITKFKDTSDYNYKIFKTWQDGFVALLNNREQDNFDKQVSTHLKKYLTIFNTGDIKDIRLYNRKLVIETTQKVLETFTDEQRQELTNRLKELRSDIDELMKS